MALITLISATGAPGVTTAAIGATMRWPRPAVLLEADLAKASGVLPGYLRGQVDHSKGLTVLAVEHQRGVITPEAAWSQIIELAPDRHLIPGFANVIAGHNAPPAFWSRLAEVMISLDAGGVDVIVDAGRLQFDDPRTPLFQLADQLAIVTRPTLPDIAAASGRLPELATMLAAAGHSVHAGLVLVDAEQENYDNREVSAVLHLPVISRLAWDPRAAAVLSQGTAPNKRTNNSALTRDLGALPGALVQAVQLRKNRLGEQPVSSTGERA